jgi:hypothetical protein
VGVRGTRGGKGLGVGVVVVRDEAGEGVVLWFVNLKEEKCKKFSICLRNMC